MRAPDRQERQPLVIERGRDRSLEQVVEIEEVAGRTRVCGCGMELLQAAFCLQRFLVQLLLIERVHDLAGGEQCIECLPLGWRKVPEIRCQRDLEPGIEYRLSSFDRPVTVRQFGGGGKRHEQEATAEFDRLVH